MRWDDTMPSPQYGRQSTSQNNHGPIRVSITGVRHGKTTTMGPSIHPYVCVSALPPRLLTSKMSCRSRMAPVGQIDAHCPHSMHLVRSSGRPSNVDTRSSSPRPTKPMAPASVCVLYGKVMWRGVRADLGALAYGGARVALVLWRGLQAMILEGGEGGWGAR